MKHGIVISDLHMFSRRSTAEVQLQLIRQLLPQTDILILNGDIVDFRWSRFSSNEETVFQGSRWLVDLISEFPACEFNYIFGNHDGLPHWKEELKRLSERFSSLKVHQFLCRFGPYLFLHGDVCDAPGDNAKLAAYRQQFCEERPRGTFLNGLYDVAIALRIPSLIVAAHRKKQMAQRILEYLAIVEAEALGAVKHIYFGHTHGAFAGFELNGVTFYNTGAAVRGLSFQIHKFTV